VSEEEFNPFGPEEEPDPTAIEQAFKTWWEVLEAEKKKKTSEEELENIYRAQIARWLARKGKE
jgi:hypothetical protein